jgi:hypothetical protein
MCGYKGIAFERRLRWLVGRHPGRVGITDSGIKSVQHEATSIKSTISKLPNFLFFRFKRPQIAYPPQLFDFAALSFVL